MFRKIVNWLKRGKVKVGKFTDFEEAKECDPNLPCREVEPNEVDGIKITLPWPGDIEDKK